MIDPRTGIEEEEKELFFNSSHLAAASGLENHELLEAK